MPLARSYLAARLAWRRFSVRQYSRFSVLFIALSGFFAMRVFLAGFFAVEVLTAFFF